MLLAAHMTAQKSKTTLLIHWSSAQYDSASPAEQNSDVISMGMADVTDDLVVFCHRHRDVRMGDEGIDLEQR